jgi:nucleotide-binding universal stress UspA family protein
MSLPRRILVATDFSDTADRALDYALALATALGGEVILVHAYEIPVYAFPDGAFLATTEISERLAEAARTALDAAIAARAGAKVAIRGVLRTGTPWTEIEAVAKEEKADLVVVGTHGRKGIARALLGSVAEKVVRTAPCPVLSVGPRG